MDIGPVVIMHALHIDISTLLFTEIIFLIFESLEMPMAEILEQLSPRYTFSGI